MRPLLLALLLLPLACDVEIKTTAKGRPAVVEDAQLLRVEIEMKTLAAELAQYHLARGEWPADWQALRRSGKDPWGNDYEFEPQGDEVSVTSAGPDGEFGTDDDLRWP